MTYPLEAARKLRQEELDAAKRALGAAIERQQEAEAVLTRAIQRREEHSAETRDAELRATRVEARSAQDLLVGQAFLQRRRTEAATLAEREQQARDGLQEAAKGVETAREALAEARAQAEAVERHHATWLRERKRLAERKAEDEADDRNAWE